MLTRPHTNDHLSREPLFPTKVKEAFYIRHNDTFNRDSGAEVSEEWTDLINRTRFCTLAP
ncbi:hypothetical protein M513_14210 [Trichuris suis]|uniref:Uncharacterized protein n=1 Tax=Trichuris suis TaxID=68888 RepID=A0A085LIW8_9BILA|nr:hypothetical protein M513_14210 [Trichuris suis]